MTANDARDRIERKSRGGEDVLPAPFPASIFVFDSQSVGQCNFTMSIVQVFLMEGFDVLQDVFEVRGNSIGQDGEAVVVALAAADDDLMVFEVDVPDSEAQAFHQSQSASI